MRHTHSKRGPLGLSIHRHANVTRWMRNSIHIRVGTCICLGLRVRLPPPFLSRTNSMDLLFRLPRLLDGSRSTDPTLGVSSPEREGTLSCRQACATVSSGPTCTSLWMDRTHASLGSYHARARPRTTPIPSAIHVVVQEIHPLWRNPPKPRRRRNSFRSTTSSSSDGSPRHPRGPISVSLFPLVGSIPLPTPRKEPRSGPTRDRTRDLWVSLPFRDPRPRLRCHGGPVAGSVTCVTSVLDVLVLHLRTHVDRFDRRGRGKRTMTCSAMVPRTAFHRCDATTRTRKRREKRGRRG